MDANAIQLTSDAFRKRLEDAFKARSDAGDHLFDGHKVHVGALDDDEAQDALAVLFLHRVATNADLRNSLHAVQSNDPATLEIHEGGLPLDLHYLLTAGNSKTGGEAPALRILGLAMQVLNDQPNLVGNLVSGETVRVTLDPVSNEEMGRIWSLFPTVNYRTSVAYLASPVWIDPATPRVEGPPVVEEPHRFWQKARTGT